MAREEALLGLEVTKLGDIDDESPWRMTVDCWDGESIRRYQVTGHYNGWPEGPPVRTLDDLAAVHGDAARRADIAQRLDALDRQAASRIAEIIHWVQREQVRVLYGQDGVDLLDEDRED